MHSWETEDARVALADELLYESYVTDKSGVKTVEIQAASFIADQETLFGEVSADYVRRELDWYLSQSLNVNGIPPPVPQIWKAVADRDGFINSNYGWCFFSAENHLQCEHVVEELRSNPESRRALAIYTRPNMWDDYNRNGRSDFMCTNAVQYMLRSGVLDCVVQMRSNDAIFGYKNDRAWQEFALAHVARELQVPYGNIYWQVGSLHVYERHFYLLDHFLKTGEHSISKTAYDELYPASKWKEAV